MIVDAFDQNFEQRSPRTYSVVPEGRREVEIVNAEIGNVAWKTSDKNPSGECLKLRLRPGREYGFVFVDLPRDRTYLFKALAAALGLEPDADGKVSLPQPHELVGRSVIVEIGHYQSRSGETRATVKKWVPAITSQPSATPQRSKPSAPRRSPGAAITARLPDGGDIPF